jgi:hypothetical protein
VAVLVSVLVGGVALAVGGVRALRDSRGTLRNVTRPSTPTFGVAQQQEVPPPVVPEPPPAPPPPRPKRAPVDAGRPRQVASPPADAGAEPEEIRKIPPPPDAGEPELDAAPQTSVKPPKIPQPEPCGVTWCPPGQSCCNASCGICTPPGVVCSQRNCSQFNVAVSVQCGMTTCNVGEECCNWSCGTCVPQGGACDKKTCDKGGLQFPTTILCGMNTCNTGYECCNPSCGTCVRPGESCSQEPCGFGR